MSKRLSNSTAPEEPSNTQKAAVKYEAIVKDLNSIAEETLIVDYGCGKGAFAIDGIKWNLSSEIKTKKYIKYIGVDIEEDHLCEAEQQAKQKGFNEDILAGEPEFLKVEGHRLAIEKNTADFVFLVSTLHDIKLIEDLAYVFYNIFRILKPGGKLIIFDKSVKTESDEVRYILWEKEEFDLLIKDLPVSKWECLPGYVLKKQSNGMKEDRYEILIKIIKSQDGKELDLNELSEKCYLLFEAIQKKYSNLRNDLERKQFEGEPIDEKFKKICADISATVAEAIDEWKKKKTLLTGETILTAIETARNELKEQANHCYNIKLAGSGSDITEPFNYIPTRMLRFKKAGREIPSEFTEKNVDPIDIENFLQLLLDKKKVLLIADAGIGKTTFLYKLQKELLEKKLCEVPLPIVENIKSFFQDSRILSTRVSERLQKTSAIGFSSEKADKIAGQLNNEGRLCFLLDALDQFHDLDNCRSHFKMDSSGIFEKNRIIVTCRTEHVKKDPNSFLDIFSSFEWIILEGFNEEQLSNYIGEQVEKWLGYAGLDQKFKTILRIPFYANITKRIGLKPQGEREKIKNRGQLLREFEKELYRELRILDKGKPIDPLDIDEIKTLLYQLSLETLTNQQIQTFPAEVLLKYRKENKTAYDIITINNWVFFNKTLFEARDKDYCTFYHQLLQEFFAACRLKQLFDEDTDEFDSALTKLSFSKVVLDLLDDLLHHELAFNHCMERFEAALTWADQKKQGIEVKNSGHKFTWLLALRDRKAEKPELKQRLQEIFDAEKEQSKKTKTDGKFVLIPAGAFLMGSYEGQDEQPVRIVYLPAYWISKYAETFREYDKYCTTYGMKRPFDWGLGRKEHPVINVSWDDAVAYVSSKGKEYSLPTEAQWEKGARGKFGRRYPWGNGEPDKNLCNFEGPSPIEVQKFEPQMYGIHQMAGNVSEWIEDDRHDDYKSASLNDGIAWIDVKRGDYRVLRGGNWHDFAIYCRSAFRSSYSPDGRGDCLGFRLSRSVSLFT